MAWRQRGRYSPRKGAKRLPERLRRRILKRDPLCKLQVPTSAPGDPNRSITSSKPPTVDPTSTGIARAFAAPVTATRAPAARQHEPLQHAAGGTYANQSATPACFHESVAKQAITGRKPLRKCLSSDGSRAVMRAELCSGPGTIRRAGCRPTARRRCQAGMGGPRLSV